MSSIATGITLLIYKGTPVGIKDLHFLSVAQGSFLKIPILMWISLGVLAIAYIIQEYTAFGRYIYAIGSNEAIPKSTGINVDKIKILVFGFSGLCIGLAGVLGASRLSWGDLSIGTGNLFPAITAVVVGGTSLSGGKGGVINTLIGALIVTVLNNGLILSDVSPVVITGLQGVIILIAVAFSFDRGKGTEVINK
jgi:ribose transport system permease protein